MESTSYVLSFRTVLFFLVTTGWIFDISLYENSINKKYQIREGVRAFRVSVLVTVGEDTISGY